MIHRCENSDFDAILEVVNDAARAYEGLIPADCWNELYMPADELRREIGDGVEFWGYRDGGELAGVMGIQHLRDVTLVRHAFVRTNHHNQAIGGALLANLRRRSTRPVLVGTWAAATWAVRFYEARGFRLVSEQEKDRLLQTYWSIPEHQTETSVVLADQAWFSSHRDGG